MKHVYKERKKTTYLEIGEQNIHQHLNIKNKHNVCKQWSQDPRDKKEVSTPPNKMKHNSPLQGHAFLPLFVMIDKGYKKQESFTRKT